jgi:hypothetical protein
VTPEGRIKKVVSTYLSLLGERLEEDGHELYVSMPVPGGYGKRNTLDYHLCFAGHLVVIETKAPGEWLTPQQRITCRNLLRSGATVFIVTGPEGMDAFKAWVERHWHHWGDLA